MSEPDSVLVRQAAAALLRLAATMVSAKSSSTMSPRNVVALASVAACTVASVSVPETSHEGEGALRNRMLRAAHTLDGSPAS